MLANVTYVHIYIKRALDNRFSPTLQVVNYKEYNQFILLLKYA